MSPCKYHKNVFWSSPRIGVEVLMYIQIFILVKPAFFLDVYASYSLPLHFYLYFYYAFYGKGGGVVDFD